jgi:hypothetical protein
MAGNAARLLERLQARDTRVLAHIRAYPGLCSYEMARALELDKWQIDQSLIQLFFDEQITFEYVTWRGPGRRKRVWRVKDQ